MGRFFEDTSVLESKDRVYKIGFYRDKTEEKKQDDKKERFCFDKILQLNDMPEPRTVIPWEEDKDKNEEEVTTKTADDDDDSKPTYDILAHERKFVQLLRKIQTWMYVLIEIVSTHQENHSYHSFKNDTWKNDLTRTQVRIGEYNR